LYQSPPAGASVEEAEAFLRNHPDVDAIDVVLVDSNGIGRGKIIRRHELLTLYQKGRHFPTSILGVDVAGEDVDATGLIWDVGDADRLVRISRKEGRRFTARQSIVSGHVGPLLVMQDVCDFLSALSARQRRDGYPRARARAH
jgi:hypothetical protein